MLVPVLLILAIIGLYNNYSDTDPASFIVFFGLIGLVYGLLSGLVLSLVTVKLRYFWMILLAAMIGFGLGGMLFGALMWQVELFSVSDSLFIQAIVRLVLSSLAFSALAGGLIGMAYQWIAQDGGYLAWRYPHRKIFVDQRSELYGPEFYRHLGSALLDGPFAQLESDLATAGAPWTPGGIPPAPCHHGPSSAGPVQGRCPGLRR